MGVSAFPAQLAASGFLMIGLGFLFGAIAGFVTRLWR